MSRSIVHWFFTILPFFSSFFFHEPISRLCGTKVRRTRTSNETSLPEVGGWLSCPRGVGLANLALIRRGSRLSWPADYSAAGSAKSAWPTLGVGLAGLWCAATVLNHRCLFRCLFEPAVILIKLLPLSPFSSTTLSLESFSTFGATRGSLIITFLPLALSACSGTSGLPIFNHVH